MESAAESARGFFSDPFNRFVALLVAVLAFYSFAFAPAAPPIVPQHAVGANASVEIQFFYHPACPHCKQQIGFNQEIADEFPQAYWVYDDVSKDSENRLFSETLARLGKNRTGTPTTVINRTVIVGFDPAATPGQLRDAISAELANLPAANETASQENAALNLPLIGKFDLRGQSLLALSVVLGLIDGFNPCAMWVLIYLISITLTMHDRKRLLFVVGTFLFAEGALYFLIMTAWLNAFMFLGYTRLVMIIVGAIACGWGLMSLREFVKNHGQIACHVGDPGEKKEIRKGADALLHAPLTIATFAGIVLLAFTINSIEFVCSAAIPAVFTQVLALQHLPWYQHYGYIFIYCVLYMLDDMVVFGLAFFAMGGSLGDRIASYGHAIGAIILLALGVMLLFAPQLLIG
ncbi:Uncharacterised protein [uncultured archaeon]|nr:Uncharacterised protein [uncultured archaeon]